MAKKKGEAEEPTGKEPEGEDAGSESVKVVEPSASTQPSSGEGGRTIKIEIGRAPEHLRRHGGTIFAVIVLILYFIDGWFRYAGFIEFNWFKLPQTILGIVGSAPFLILFLIYIFTLKEFNKQTLLAAVSYAAVVIFVIITGMAGLTWLAFIHLLFILSFWYVKMYRPSKKDPSGLFKANLSGILLIFLDFYLYSFLKNFSVKYAAIPLSIPILAVFVIGYIWVTEEENKTVWVLFVIMLVCGGKMGIPV